METVNTIIKQINNYYQKSQDETLQEATRKTYLNKAKQTIKNFNLGTEGACWCSGLDFTKTLPTSGIYLIGMKFFLNQNSVPTYALKVGMSSKISQRVKSYSSYNPGAVLLDIYYTQQPKEWECNYQEQLKALCPVGFCGSQEWSLVNEELYNLAIEHGLNCFHYYTKVLAKTNQIYS